MGNSQNCVCCHRKRNLSVSLLFLLISSLILVTFMAEGRAISKLIEAAQKGSEEEKMVVMRSKVGSMPPKCERKCRSCSNCEAVQVPVTTKATDHLSAAIAYSRGDDDISNYKPMSWKCKCGNFIFNP